MMSRPPIALPSDATEEIAYEFEESVLYATVNKSKPETKRSENGDLDKDDDDEHISENKYTIVKEGLNSPQNQIRGEIENTSGATVPVKEKNRIPFSITPSLLEERFPITEKYPEGWTDKQYTEKEQELSYSCEHSGYLPKNERNVRNIDNTNDEVSEGQMLTLSVKSPEKCSDLQLLYLSNETIDVNVGEDDFSKAMLPDEETTTYSKKHVLPEQLNQNMPGGIQSKNIHSNKIQQSFEANFKLNDNPTKEVTPRIMKNKEMSSTFYNQEKRPMSTTPVKLDYLRVEDVIGNKGNMSGESETPHNYLHMSPHKSSGNSSNHNLVTKSKINSKNLKILTPLQELHADSNELQLRSHLGQQLSKSIGALNSLYNADVTDAQRTVIQHNIQVLVGMSASNNEFLQNRQSALRDIHKTINTKLTDDEKFGSMESQLKSFDLENKNLHDLNDSLMKENDLLKQKISNRDPLANEQPILIAQLNHIKEQNRSLNALVHRLTNELKRPKEPLKTNHTVGGDLPQLLQSYDEQLKEKTQLIQLYEQKLSMLEKNASLMEKIPEGNEHSVSYGEWHQLKEQSRLVLQENQLLVDQKILYKNTIDDLTSQYQHEVNKLSEKSTQYMQEKKSLDFMLSEAHLELSQLKSKYNKLIENMTTQVDSVEHDEEVERIQRSHNQKSNKLQTEINNLQSQLQVLSGERDRLAIQVTDLTADNSRLQLEIDMTKKNYRRCEKRLLRCLHQLETANGREISAKKTLSRVLKVAEKNSSEKAQLARLVESQKEKTDEALDKATTDDRKCIQLKQQIQELKNRSKIKVNDMKKQLRDQGKEMERLKIEYEDELDKLKNIVRQKEKWIDRVQSNKASTELQMNEMCNSLNIGRIK
ncbi:centrosomal protein of 89 kDa-like [Hydractinia symbiolongicarpus]|uniref:centrosomal protein of 89 kDa-like n=1 Tax=Hydractinia symbiolongicarpus TaxID=13093 RepID=UPI00254F9308|nr:centrosomal protein of 89 kDa-like [Hydractinia symbiolongicarpus]XP_057291255.1 centrosomal protein of 89 kDa-like [Hydractinia symbiolongicarpus]